MMSTVHLELTSFINPELTWKTSSKRNRSGTRRSRKPGAKSLTMGKGLADTHARKLEDVTVSDPEKLGVDVLGRHFSEKVENIPIKKRRFMFRSRSPPPPLTPYPHLEDSEQQVKISEVINGVKDLSGIEILAAAACSDSICNDVAEFEENPSVEESVQVRIQSSASSVHLEETTASLETACCFPKDSVNESKSEGSSFQDNSFAVLHQSPSNKDATPERSVLLHEFPSGEGTDLSVNESKSEGSSFQDNSFDASHEFPSDKDTTQEMSVSLPDDRLLWDLNVSMDAWPRGGGNVDSQKDSFHNISEGSEELQTRAPQDMKNDTTIDVVSSDIERGNRMTSDMRTMPVGTDDLSTEKLESGYASQNIINDTAIGVVSSDADGGNRMTSDLTAMHVGTDDSSTEKQESGEGSQNFKNDTTVEVVSSDVDEGTRMTSDLNNMPNGTDDLSKGKQENEGCSDYDSQFEDGELRESDIQYWEEAEQVDYDTEFEEERSFSLEAECGEQELKVERGSNPELTDGFKSRETGVALRKHSVSLKVRNAEVSDAETMKIDYLDGSDYDFKVDLSKESKKDLLSCVEGSLSSDDVQKSRFNNSNGSYPRAERGTGSDKFMGSDRSSHMRAGSPGGSQFFCPPSNYWDSKRSHPSIYHGPYNFGRPRSKRVFEDREYPVGTEQLPSDAAGVARPDHRISRQYMGSYRPVLRRRSPIERDDSYNMHPRMPAVRDSSPDRNRFRRYPQGVSRGIRDEYMSHLADDGTPYMNRNPCRLDRRERSISPQVRRPHHTAPYRRPRSRSRSRSPIDWLLQRDRNEGSRRHNRSPEFRSDPRMDRVRLPFTKRFAAGYGEFISPPRDRVSPVRNSRMLEDRNPGFDHFRGRKSHVRMIRQDQRFHQVRSIRRLNSNDYFNPMIRPRGFPDPDRAAAGRKGCKYDEVSDDGKHGSRHTMINRVRCYDTDG